jgi:hypothetical protein
MVFTRIGSRVGSCIRWRCSPRPGPCDPAIVFSRFLIAVVNVFLHNTRTNLEAPPLLEREPEGQKGDCCCLLVAFQCELVVGRRGAAVGGWKEGQASG